jgi:hypothetical protein
VKAITLHQPWASLVALGVKTVETRSWPAPLPMLGQPLAIHAGRTKVGYPDVPMEVWSPLCGSTPGLLRDDVRPLPLGAVVATCRLAACVPMVHLVTAMVNPESVPWPNVQLNGPDVASFVQADGACTDLGPQRPYGDFRSGRWAWMLEDIVRINPPIPARGRQRVWNWDPASVQ